MAPAPRRWLRRSNHAKYHDGSLGLLRAKRAMRFANILRLVFVCFLTVISRTNQRYVGCDNAQQG